MHVRSIAGAILGSALMFAAVGITPAAATTHNTQGTQTVSASGLAGVGSGINAFKVDLQASKTADGSVSGRFQATGDLTALGIDVPLPATLAGPVTCLSVHGDTAALLYPVSNPSPALLGPLLSQTSILITVQQGTAGKPATIGFLGPIPTALTQGCEPTIAPFTVQGTVTIN